jgi:trehalose-6-phosphate synthase
VGIDRDVLCHRLDLPEVQAHEARLRERCRVGERIVTGGVEMLNPLQGAQIKLLAYEKLLENYAMWRPRLTMLQVGAHICLQIHAPFLRSALWESILGD